MSEDDPCVLSLYQLPIAADYNSSARARLVLPARWPTASGTPLTRIKPRPSRLDVGRDRAAGGGCRVTEPNPRWSGPREGS